MYYQRSNPNPLTPRFFSVNSMVGGLNNTDYTPEDNQAVFIKNMSFSDGDAMVKRFGTDYYNEMEHPRDVVFIDRYTPYTDDFEGDENLITSTMEKMYFGGEEVVEVKGLIDGENFMGMYLFADGVALRALGSFPQDESTYVRIVGTATTDYIIMEVTDPPSNYTPLDKTHVRGVTVYDYGQRKIWYEPCENELDDVFMGASIIPKNCRYIVSHNGRLYASGDQEDDDNVFLSAISNPFYFPVALPLQMPPNADKIVALTVFDDSVVVGRHNDIHVVSGNSNNPNLTNDLFRLRKLNTHTGFMSSDSFSRVHNYLFFLGSDKKCYALSNISYDNHLLSTTVISNQIDLTREPLSFTDEDLENSRSVFYNDEWHVAIGDRWLVYSYEHRAWTVYYNLPARSFCVLDNELTWGSAGGRLVKFYDGYLDLEKPFECRVTTKTFDMGSPVHYKYFREFFAVAHIFDEYPSDIRISFQVDYLSAHTKNLLRNQKSRWGFSKWGDRFITNNINISYPIPVHLRGRFISFSFANGWDEQDSVRSYIDLANVRNKVDEETLVYVEDEEVYYLYTERDWVELSPFELNQAMKVYEISGDYTMRSQR